jgi:hypothetical protein
LEKHGWFVNCPTIRPRIVASVAVASHAISCLMLLAGSVDAAGTADDVLLLEHGGRVHGQWQNRDKGPEDNYVISLPDGGQLTLSPSQVQRAIVEAPRAIDHDELQPAWGSGQVREHWTKRHLYIESRGYQRHAGRWRVPQDIQVIEERQESDRIEKDWLRKLRQWRAMLTTDASREGYRKIAAVTDPMAVPALRQLLREERFRQPKLLYIDVLGSIGGSASALALVEASLQDPDEEIFHASLAQLVRHRPPHVIKPYVESLTDEQNTRLNRAAHALGRLGDQSVISPLIDVLVTTHYVVLQPKLKARTATFVNSAPQDANAPFSGTGFSSNQPPLVLVHTYRNEEVLASPDRAERREFWIRPAGMALLAGQPEPAQRTERRCASRPTRRRRLGSAKS